MLASQGAPISAEIFASWSASSLPADIQGEHE